MWESIIIVSTILCVSYLWIDFSKNRRVEKKIPQNGNADLVKVLLGLEQANLENLFQLYAREFGPAAARYARGTYYKWKSGEVRPNKQTFNRFLVHLPTVMSFDLKCEVLRKLRQEYCSKDNYSLAVDPQDWKETLAPLIDDLVNKSYAAQLPKHVEERLRWLSADDMQIASAVLTASQAQESKNAMRLLEQEFGHLEQLLKDTRGRSEVTHIVKLPVGTITLTIRGR
jgi:hypothetical protein